MLVNQDLFWLRTDIKDSYSAINYLIRLLGLSMF